MPPEFYRNGSYDFEGDWWALGCLLYEVSTGSPPFVGLDLKRLSTKIIYTEPNYSDIKDQNLRSLIKALLVKDPC